MLQNIKYRFSDGIFNSYENLAEFFEHSKDLQRIVKAAEHPLPLKPLSYTRAHLISMDLRRLFYGRCQKLLHRFEPLERALPNLTRRCHVFFENGKQRNATPVFLREIKGQLLARSVNYYQTRIHDLYLHKKVYLELNYPSLESGGRSNLEFFHAGLCAGIAHWFIYLYFKTKHLFVDSMEYHLSVLCKLFSEGASYEASLLEGLYKFHAAWLARCLIQIEVESSSPMTTEKLCQSVNQEFFEALPNGCSLISLFQIHQMICFKNDQGFLIFDPNVGLIKFSGEDQVLQLHSFLVKYANQLDPQQASRIVFRSIQPIERDPEEGCTLKMNFRGTASMNLS